MGLFADVELWALESEGGLTKGMNSFRKLKSVVDCEQSQSVSTAHIPERFPQLTKFSGSPGDIPILLVPSPRKSLGDNGVPFRGEGSVCAPCIIVLSNPHSSFPTPLTIASPPISIPAWPCTSCPWPRLVVCPSSSLPPTLSLSLALFSPTVPLSLACALSPLLPLPFFRFRPASPGGGYSHSLCAATHRRHAGKVSSHLTFRDRHARQPAVERVYLTLLDEDFDWDY